jgi:hypothetical protein
MRDGEKFRDLLRVDWRIIRTFGADFRQWAEQQHTLPGWYISQERELATSMEIHRYAFQLLIPKLQPVIDPSEKLFTSLYQRKADFPPLATWRTPALDAVTDIYAYPFQSKDFPPPVPPIHSPSP